MSPDKLAYMANQIGKFFAHQKHDQAVAAIADHLDKFWDPRMRSGILAHLDEVQLDPLVREAVTAIAARSSQ
jgi:formate dehydrogenase subunit delta